MIMSLIFKIYKIFLFGIAFFLGLCLPCQESEVLKELI